MTPLQKNRKKFLGSDFDARIRIVIDVVNDVWSKCDQPFPFLSYSAMRCEKVEEQLYKIDDALIDKKILKRKSMLNSEEKFLLIAAIWLQDIGMCQILLGDDKENYHALGRKWGSYVRKYHAVRSADFIEHKCDVLGLASEEMKILCKICSGHRRKDYNELYTDEYKWKGAGPNLPLVIAHLRLADSLHIPGKKLYPSNFEIHHLIHMDETTRFHWLKLRYLEAVEFDRETFAINIFLRRPINIDSKRMASLEDIIRHELQDELDSVKDILIEGGGFPFLKVVCSPFGGPDNEKEAKQEDSESEEDAKELKALLNNLQLFDSTLTPSASALIENVLNHIDMLIDVQDESILVKNLKEYLEGSLDKTIEERPCYVVLRKIRYFLDTILRSEYNERDRFLLIKNAVSIIREKRKAAIKKIPKKSYEITASASSLLLYGLSSTIVECLKYMFKHSRSKIKCYVCEARTKTEYRFNNRLTYSDGIKYVSKLMEAKKIVKEELIANNVTPPDIEIKLIPDASASNLFSRKKISMVLMGANGISSTGTVGHTLGHLAIADMALEYAVPVYVIASSLKIGIFEQKPDVRRKNVWHTTDIAFVPNISEDDTINWREDIVPPEKITNIITDKGRIEPRRVWEHEDVDWLTDLIPAVNADGK